MILILIWYVVDKRIGHDSDLLVEKFHYRPALVRLCQHVVLPSRESIVYQDPPPTPNIRLLVDRC